MKATPEQFNQLAGEVQTAPLTYADFMDSYRHQLKQEALTRKIKRQQQAAERYRRKQRIKGRLITVAWTVLIVGFAAAAIVWR